MIQTCRFRSSWSSHSPAGRASRGAARVSPARGAWPTCRGGGGTCTVTRRNTCPCERRTSTPSRLPANGFEWVFWNDVSIYYINPMKFIDRYHNGDTCTASRRNTCPCERRTSTPSRLPANGVDNSNSLSKWYTHTTWRLWGLSTCIHSVDTCTVSRRNMCPCERRTNIPFRLPANEVQETESFEMKHAYTL